MISDFSLKIRPSISDDAEFAFNTMKETIRKYAIETWGQWYQEESRQSAIEDTSTGKIGIIELEGESIGILTVVRDTQKIEIEQIYILPKYQNKGIGSKLLAMLQKEAKERCLPLKLVVLAVNPAINLYNRLGFRNVKTANERIFMEYWPQSMHQRE